MYKATKKHPLPLKWATYFAVNFSTITPLAPSAKKKSVI